MTTQSKDLPHVGLCGLGAMGRGMANNLLKKGFTVSGFDVIPNLLSTFVQQGGKSTSSPKEAAQNADVLLIMVVNFAQVTSVLFQEETGAIFGLRKNVAVIIASTVPAAYIREVRQKLDKEFGRPDIQLLDCPVSGGASGAADGTLAIFACGTDEGLKVVNPVLQAVGTKIHRIRNSTGEPGLLGSGANGKVCNQVITQIAIAHVGEIMALAVRAGLNTRKVYDFIQASEGKSWIMENRIPHALEGDTTIYSAMKIAQKDSSIVVRTAGEISFPVPLVATAEQIYQTIVAVGWGHIDDSALWRIYLKDGPNDAVYQNTKRPEDNAGASISVEDIVDIMIGVQLATAAECKGFTKAVGLDAGQMYEIIGGAAGWSVQFEKYAPRMNHGPWYLNDVKESKEIGARLVAALNKASSIGAPMPISSAAAQVFQLQVGPLSG